eukprot:COSAG06_NODE_53650_length_299_cov_0.510000_2_plen_35_part_01
MTQKSIMDYVNVTAPKEAAKQSAAAGDQPIDPID